MKWDWEDIWSRLVVCVTLSVILFTFIVAERELRSYYLSNARGTPAVCVRAEWTWDEDSVVFCTDNRDVALDFVKRANETLK